MVFPDVNIGLRAFSDLVIQNDGNSDLVVTRVNCPVGFQCPWTGVVPGGSKRIIPVVFAPSQAGVYAGTISVDSNATAGRTSLASSGRGTIGKGDNGWHIERIAARVYPITNGFYPSYPFRTAVYQRICVTPNNEIAILDREFAVLSKSTLLGAVKVFAGRSGYFGGTDGDGLAARFQQPSSIACSPSGYLYATDGFGVRQIDPNGVVTTIFSDNIDGFEGPAGAIAYSPGGALYFLDYRYRLFKMDRPGTVRKAELLLGKAQCMSALSDGRIAAALYSDGVIQVRGEIPGTNQSTFSTVIGDFGNHGFRDGSWHTAQFNSPSNIAVDHLDNLYVADMGNDAIRMIQRSDFSVQTVLGNNRNWKPDGVFGTNALLSNPVSVAVDSDQNLVILMDTGGGILRGIRRNSPIRNLTPVMVGDVSTIGVGESDLRDLCLMNTGTDAVHVRGIKVPEGFKGAWAGTIAPGGSVHVPVEFRSSIRGSFHGAVLLDSDANQGADLIDVEWVAVENPQRKMTVLGDLDFGECAVGEEIHRSMTNFISGTATVNVSGVLLPAGFYGATKVAATPKNSSTTNEVVVDITFRPSEDREYGGLLIVNTDATGSVNYVSISGRGRPKAGPRLQVAVGSPSGPLRVSWPLAYSGYILESSSLLGPGATWTPLTNGIVTEGNESSFSIEKNRLQSFFRLRKP
jgi:hypothetical protein